MPRTSRQISKESVIGCALATLVAGCAGASQGIPNAGSGTAQWGAAYHVDPTDVARSRTSPVALLELEIAGKIPVPIARPVLLRMLAAELSGRTPHIRFDHTAKVGIWADPGCCGYIFGQDSKGGKTVTGIDAKANGCEAPNSLKVDHGENLWLACNYYGSLDAGPQEYKPGSKAPAATYREQINCGNGCTYEASAFDVAFDSSGHVFVSNNFSQECKSSCVDGVYPAAWWNESSPSSPATGIKDPDLTNGDYLDVDSAGNLYVGGFGCVGSSCGYLVDEIGSPTTSPAIANLIPPGVIVYADSLYVSNHGKVLDLVDSNARTMSQYALPWIPSEAPFNVLGPTPTNYYGQGYPFAGGFNSDNTRVVLGDAYGWLDIGSVRKNRWSLVTNENLYQGVLDAAYVPSDK